MNLFKMIMFVVFLLLIAQVVGANELMSTELKIINNNFNNYSISKNNSLNNINIHDITCFTKYNNKINFYGGKGGGFLAMGIVGASLFGLGWLVVIPGIAITVYAYLMPISSSGSNVWESVGTIIGTAFIKTLLLACGIALIVIGSIFVVVGLPLMIAGFINFSRKRKNNVSFILDANKDGTINTGLKILM